MEFDKCLNVVHVGQLSKAEANNKHSDKARQVWGGGIVVVVVVALL